MKTAAKMRGVGFSALQRAENSSIAPSSDGNNPERYGFSALQRAENSSMRELVKTAAKMRGFSALQRAENSSIRRGAPPRTRTQAVSVLFSEPKIPQCVVLLVNRDTGESFSALQRAENSSMHFAASDNHCVLRFSALQRAENSSMIRRYLYDKYRREVSVLFSEPKIPQYVAAAIDESGGDSFSALQRAENSSIRVSSISAPRSRCFSALQRAENSSIYRNKRRTGVVTTSFSALQRAENSSIWPRPRALCCLLWFQCSSASRKFLNILGRAWRAVCEWVSVLFSEPKIPQFQPVRPARVHRERFSALQRAENSSIRRGL